MPSKGISNAHICASSEIIHDENISDCEYLAILCLYSQIERPATLYLVDRRASFAVGLKLRMFKTLLFEGTIASVSEDIF